MPVGAAISVEARVANGISAREDSQMRSEADFASFVEAATNRSVSDHAREFGTLSNPPNVPSNIFPCRSKRWSDGCQPGHAAARWRADADHANAPFSSDVSDAATELAGGVSAIVGTLSSTS